MIFLASNYQNLMNEQGAHDVPVPVSVSDTEDRAAVPLNDTKTRLSL